MTHVNADDTYNDVLVFSSVKGITRAEIQDSGIQASSVYFKHSASHIYAINKQIYFDYYGTFFTS
jgi:hypothetical protein